MTTCCQCGRPSRQCACPRQTSLLEPMPEWHGELQQRLDAYRARRGRTSPAERTSPAARVLTWRPAAEPVVEAEPAPEPGAPVAMLRPLSSVEVCEPQREPAQPSRDVRVDAAAAAMPAARALPKLPAQRWQEPWDRGELLQLPLPMLAAKAETPSLPAIAARGLRAHAALLDACIVAGGALVFALTAWANQHFAAPGPHWFRAMLPALAGVPTALAAIYLWLCGRCGGATPGMRSLGLRVAGQDGGTPTPEALRRRTWASLISLGALGLGFLWMWWEPQGLTWHDAISRTCVVEND